MMITKTCLFCKFSTINNKTRALARLSPKSELKIHTYCSHTDNKAHHTAPIGPPRYTYVPINQITSSECQFYEK